MAHNKIPAGVEAEALRLYRDLRSSTKVAEILGIHSATVCRIVNRNKNAPKHKAEPPQSNCRVLVIPDTHHPFQHPDALDFLCAVYEQAQLDTVVHLGDEMDGHSFSRYTMDVDAMTPKAELAATIEALRPWYRAFPNVKVCESNHTVRPWKKAYEAGLPDTFLPSYAQALDAPDGWQWRDMWEIDGVLYFHGDKGKSGKYAHRNYVDAYHKSCVIGHIHAHAGINWDGNLFGMNAGCLIDERAYAFKYAKAYTGKVNLGCGIVLNGKEAYFIPMQTDSAGRWTGSLLV